MRQSLPLVLAAAAVLVPSPARAADDDPLQGFTGARALEIATELSSDAMKGRKTGFEGGGLAEDWMQGIFGRLGLDPMDRDGVYLQTFTFDAADTGADLKLALDGEALAYRTDFTEIAYGGEGTAKAEVVFVGYGISAKDRGWDDYEGVDVTGKVVLAIRGAPSSREAEFETDWMIGAKAALAASKGAAGFLLAEGTTPVSGGTIQARWHQPALPSVWVSSATVDRIVGKRGRTFADLKRTRDAGDPGRSFATGAEADLEAHGKFLRNARGRNALGGIHGRDPAVRGEVVLVGAHMDHIGVDPTGQVYNGADDNASGSGVLVALAETLKKNRWRPRRTVVFCAFAGEEQGLVGSRHLVTDQPFAGRVVAMLNVDAVGQGTIEGGVAHVNLGGGERYPDMAARIWGFLPKDVPVHPFAVHENSDHWPFFDRGVPAFFAVTRGEHPNYHSVNDDAVGLKVACLEAAGKVVGRALVGLGDIEEPLANDRALAEYLLRAPGRVVDAPDAAAALATALAAGPGDAVRDGPLRAAGVSALVLPVDEGEEGAAVAWARLEVSVRRHAAQAGIVKGAGDLVNATRAGRLAVLPRLRCARSAKAFPEVLSVYRRMGALLVAPFDPAVPLTADERAAVLATAASAGVLVDLTGLPEDALADARTRLAKAPALYALPAGDARPVAEVRHALGPYTVLVVSGAQGAALLSAAALAETDDPAMASVWVASGDLAALSAALAEAEAGGAGLVDHEAPARARLFARLGGALAAALRRLP